MLDVSAWILKKKKRKKKKKKKKRKDKRGERKKASLFFFCIYALMNTSVIKHVNIIDDNLHC